MSVDHKRREPKCCVVYTTDETYLFPTLVSAMQARRHASKCLADVIIVAFGLSDEAYRVFKAVCQPEDIILSRVDYALIEHQTAMLARFFLNRLLPEQYSQCLYLDGDVQILGSLDTLLDADVPDGHFLAANDPMTFQLADNTHQSRDLVRHLQLLGLSSDQSLRYFNSGVIRINLRGWDEIGSKAWEHFRAHGNLSRFQDQDSLNVVAANQRLPMSLAWNYPVFMHNSRVESDIRPRIVHFMSNPKPWQGAFPPWTREAYLPYIRALEQYPQLTPFCRSLTIRTRAIYHLQQRVKRISEILMWGWTKRRGRILSYEEELLGEGLP